MCLIAIRPGTVLSGSFFLRPLLIVVLILPSFNELTQKNLRLLFQPGLILRIVGLALTAGLAAGIYPAFYLSAFRPVSVLKGKPDREHQNKQGFRLVGKDGKIME
jgi:ABC-type antimicrobial peptide transport system permease subunit